MNFIFFSPHFPAYCTEFCLRLSGNGVRVLGIGDIPYEHLAENLRASLTEYYRVSDMANGDEVIRAVGYFTYRYGKIDRFESLNEHWLELEARIRTEFNIYGIKLDFIDNLKQKSKMKAYFQKSGVDTVQLHKSEDKASALEFIERVGYPIVAKPDLGSGASMTCKISTSREFDNFFTNKPVNVPFVLEEYVDGVILTYDGLIDRYGHVAFATSHLFEQSIMEVVNADSHLYYFCLPAIDPAVEKAGRNILKALDVRERFFHIELFRRHRDGKIIALEINMRPCMLHFMVFLKNLHEQKGAQTYPQSPRSARLRECPARVHHVAAAQRSGLRRLGVSRGLKPTFAAPGSCLFSALFPDSFPVIGNT